MRVVNHGSHWREGCQTIFASSALLTGAVSQGVSRLPMKGDLPCRRESADRAHLVFAGPNPTVNAPARVFAAISDGPAYAT
jgi:hypothetical protein